MTKKYQFRYLLPLNGSDIEKLLRATIEKISQGGNERNEIFLSLTEGIAIAIRTNVQFLVTTKLAYEPGKVCPCYASALASFNIGDSRVCFPYGGEETRKVNMYFVESPAVRILEDSDVEDISEITGFHAPFLPEHKNGRYVGTAFERASMILDLYGHMVLFQLNYQISGGYVMEYFDWVFRAAGITQEEFYQQIRTVAQSLSMEKNIQPFFECDLSEKSKAS